MRWAALASLLLHLAALAAVLARLPPRLPPRELPAHIEVVFGRNARAQGAPASAPRSAVSAPAAASPSLLPPASLAPPASPPRKRVELVASPPTAAADVRLGDGLVGFDVPQPDAGMTAAQADPGNRPPPYPEAAWQRREHGTVVLRIHVRPDGLVGLVETVQSSGSDALDAAAITAARSWRFVPQMREGLPVASVRDQAMHFVLE